MRKDEVCGILLPTYEVAITPREEHVECIIPLWVHEEWHMGKFPDGRTFIWTFDVLCDCEVDCDCYEGQFLSDEDFAPILDCLQGRTEENEAVVRALIEKAANKK